MGSSAFISLHSLSLSIHYTLFMNITRILCLEVLKYLENFPLDEIALKNVQSHLFSSLSACNKAGISIGNKIQSMQSNLPLFPC
jgi:hypothetical protein